MQWSDEGFVLGMRSHGESGAILEVMTLDHGRHLGMVRGGRSRRLQPLLQPGNSLAVTWSARLDQQLGSFVVEPMALRVGDLMGSRAALAGLTHLGCLARLLPERDPYPGVFEALSLIADRLSDPMLAAPLIVRFELEILARLGFGLDLVTCAATGRGDDLAYVSPKTARAVSREAGEPWKDRLLPLPGFLIGSGAVNAGDLAAGFRLTGHFLSRHVFEPRGLAVPDARQAFIAALDQRALARIAPVA